ncbi:HAD family hydrolase [Oxalobacteraceae bacterium OM1]|nr:HAD family hydrolase [Oxalobacteraceae bacterium OM1]
MAPIKAVLFDLDDTLWPIVPVIRRAEDILHAWLREQVPDVAARFSIDAMRARRQELMATDPVYQLDLRKLRHAGLVEAFQAAGADVRRVDEAMAVFSRARNDVTPFDDVLPVLKALRARHAVGSVSNGVADLHMIGIAHLFDASVAAHHVGVAKPDAGIFHAACTAIGVPPEQAVYAGDDPLLDVEGAQRAGLQAAWLARPELPLRQLPDHVRPDIVCRDLHDLHAWLQGRQ